MEKIDIKELRVIQMELLDFFADFCDKHGLKYWLDCGTMLGAVRHKGFIPWDDDIDLGMPREDYNKFIELFEGENINPNFSFHSFETDGGSWHLPFGKLFKAGTLLKQDGYNLEINVDIFPYDEAPDTFEGANKTYKKRDFLKKLNFLQSPRHNNNGNIIKRTVLGTLKFFLRLFPKHYFIRLIEKSAKSNNNRGYTKMSNFCCDISMHPTAIKNVDRLIDGEFEGKLYKIPEGYADFLTCLYGADYMTPPPEGKRKMHSFEAFILK